MGKKELERLKIILRNWKKYNVVAQIVAEFGMRMIGKLNKLDPKIDKLADAVYEGYKQLNIKQDQIDAKLDELFDLLPPPIEVALMMLYSMNMSTTDPAGDYYVPTRG